MMALNSYLVFQAQNSQEDYFQTQSVSGVILAHEVTLEGVC